MGGVVRVIEPGVCQGGERAAAGGGGADAADLFLQQWFNLSDPGERGVQPA